jgi:hypothetical protein
MDELDLSRAEPTGSVDVLSDGAAIALVLGACLLFAALVALTTLWGVRLARERPVTGPRLGDLPPALRLLGVLVVAALLCVQGTAAADAYVQTRVIHGSAHEYFQYMTNARLLGTSHAHLFGYTMMYGIIALLAALSGAREGLKAALVAILSWAGLFDVLSWWGMKHLSGRFEWLAMLTGIASAGGSFVAFVLVVRSLRRP